MERPHARPGLPGKYLILATSVALLAGGGLMAANASQGGSSAKASGTAAGTVEQVAQRGTETGTADVNGAAGARTAGAGQVCDRGAKWLRVRFDQLSLRGGDTVTLKGSEGGSYTLTAANWPGRAFHTRAFQGECVSVTPKLSNPGSRFSIDAYQSGASSLVRTSVTVAAAGDICGGDVCGETARLVSAMRPEAVLTAGDNAYERGTLSEYNRTYDPTWGRFNRIVHPAPGNHEYKTRDASGYFSYFEGKGVNVGGRGRGFYSYDVGDWHMVSLNTGGGVSYSAGSEQEKWLRADLRASTKPCTMATWHHPMFSSGDHGDQRASSALYKALTDFKADVVVSGHDHHYERFAPAMADGRKDAANGVRELLIGTGGRGLYSSTQNSRGPSEKFNKNTHGVGEFQLSSTGYSFNFRPIAGRTFTDSVSGTCHNKGRGGGAAPAPAPSAPAVVPSSSVAASSASSTASPARRGGVPVTTLRSPHGSDHASPSPRGADAEVTDGEEGGVEEADD
ncbi:metallophosphoesterase [Streptomyces sp. NPDC048290]|uniref:metallophosphoesterase family protein n=1 Tax=Streptomyces sp. NPDC048290 TaxID=3155811 RepID=UPI0034251C5C